MSTSQFAVKIGPQELGQIFTLRKNLDLMRVLARFAEHYRRLGWPLAALEAQSGADLDIDFTSFNKPLTKRLMDETLQGREVNLAVRLGASARVFALKIAADQAPLQLDKCGPWRSTCIAALKNRQEQHFYRLPEAWELPSSAPADHIQVLGEGALAFVPPSLEPDTGHNWRWLKAPWESPPCPPPAGLRRFLEKHDLFTVTQTEPEPRLLAWSMLFPQIARHKDLLSTLLAPPVSAARYYREIITEALKAGINESKMLQSLLWHAPHGEARRSPELWGHLVSLVTELTRTGRPASFQHGRKGLGQERTSPKPLVHHLERLAARTLELERQLADLQQAPKGHGRGRRDLPCWKEWLALIQRSGLDDKDIQDFKRELADFLRKNPDLAGDEKKLVLVRYCYANYIKIDPAYDGLPERDRLAGAGEMARTFLNSPVLKMPTRNNPR
ncbi:MAG: hypothetical protein QME75_04010 [Deltaproteobacteria bacterium]|nr:hypothetical protein [Deltaproteobacteria bacterium]